MNDVWIVVFATLLGPVLAVQAQKAIERGRERLSRKSWVFHQLMATRAARVSPEHVQALNMIDLAFYGRRIVNLHRRTKSEQSVIDAWREYHDHLNTKADETTIQLWYVQGDELFTNLLFSMAIDVGYKFDRVQLKKGAYSPIAHGELEEQQQTIRRLAIGILSGELPLKMDVTSLPMDEEIMKSQAQISSKLAAAFSDEGALIVDIKKASINKSDL